MLVSKIVSGGQTGVDRGAIAARTLQGISFDLVYSSDLKRAIETKEIAMPGVAFLQSALLREIHVGALAGKALAACEAEYGAPYLRDRTEKNFLPYGGEDHKAHRARVAAFLQELAAKNATRVAVFCHEGTIQRCLELVTGSEEVSRRRCENGGVCLFEYTGGKWSLVQWEI